MELRYDGSDERENLVTRDPQDRDYIADEYLESLDERGELLKELIISWRSMFIVLNTRSKARVTSGRSLVKFSPGEGQGMVLMRLGAHNGITQAQLARELDITPQTLGTHLRKLEEQGLIARKKDPDDRRALLVKLTPKGKKALHALQAEEQFSGSMFEVFTMEEMAELKYLVEKLDKRLRDEIEASNTAAVLLHREE